MAGNFGPDNQRVLDMEQTYTVWVRPGGRLRFRFSFEAYHENATLIYTEDTLEKVAERGNYFRSDDDWELQNNSGADAGFVITGWHKNSPPSSEYVPWYQSRIKVFVQSDKVVSVGFEDIPTDADFNDAVVTVNIWSPPPSPPPPPPPALRARTFVRAATIFVAGAALGLGLRLWRGALNNIFTRRKDTDDDD